MTGERKYSYQEGRIGKYKYIRTSNFDGAITIYIKKRLFGFLWWAFMKDKFGSPMCFNRQNQAEAFMKGILKYEYRCISEYAFVGDKTIETVYLLTDERAKDKIVQIIFDRTGEVIDPDCAMAAWVLDGKKYIHRAIDYAQLWNYIYKSNGNKLWNNPLQKN